MIAESIVPRFYTQKAVVTMLGIGRTTFLRMVENRQFPSPIKLCSARNMWPDHEVEKMIALISSGLAKEELVEYVMEIENARKELIKS
ncbi:TPA: AlpA family phage regulatory protein [Vibrio parahaemolyticus]|nr:AlpA family phage regulatory protein [Vibrio parahaemolyticus]